MSDATSNSSNQRQPRCFVIGPIGSEDSEARIHADWLYTGIIEPVFAADFPQFKLERADKIPTPGMVSAQIISRLYEAELVIADLSFHNANAFYEMAIRHNVGKPIIHMIRKNENIPFDVIPHRAIPFSVQRAQSLEEAKNALRPAIEQAIQAGFKPDNPITHALGQIKLQTTASPEMKVITDEVAALRAQVNQLISQMGKESELATIRRLKSSNLAELFREIGNLDPSVGERSQSQSLTDLGKGAWVHRK